MKLLFVWAAALVMIGAAHLYFQPKAAESVIATGLMQQELKIKRSEDIARQAEYRVLQRKISAMGESVAELRQSLAGTR